MVLATIVSVRGSTYRRPGARLLVSDSGEVVGNLSGGCLEDEVEQLAQSVMDEGFPRLTFFDLTDDDEVVWGWGMGCNGAIEVFLEPTDNAAGVADALRLAIEEERPLAMATVIESSASAIALGARLLVYPGNDRQGSLGSQAAYDAVTEAAANALSLGHTEMRSLTLEDGELRLFIEVLEPPLRLLVCGAGHDAIPLVQLASSLGWRVLVVDDRKELLDPKRFPGAKELVLARPDEVTDAVGVDRRTNVVIMSHNFLRDKAYLRSFLRTEAAYVGTLGPGARLERLLEDLGRNGVRASDEDLSKIHGPAGLDIGSETPEEIAAAIVTEILAVSHKRPGGFLKKRKAPIHDDSRTDTRTSTS